MKVRLTMLIIGAWAGTVMAQSQGYTGGDDKMNADQARQMFQEVKHSLADSIRTAEKQTNGKAISAKCCFKSKMELDQYDKAGMQGSSGSTTTGGQPSTSGQPGQSGQPGHSGQTGQPGQHDMTGNAGKQVVCVVTCLTPDNKLSEVIINTQTGQVIKQRNVENVGDERRADANPDRVMTTGSQQTGMDDRQGANRGISTGAGSTTTTQGNTGDNRSTSYVQATNTQTGQPSAQSNQDMNRTQNRMNDPFAPPHRLQKGTDLNGKRVTNSADENLGKLEDFVVDPTNGRILYGVVSFGGFLGIGEKWFAVPWQSLELTSDAKAFMFNVDKQVLKDAEGFDKDKWPNFADERWATSTYQRYGQPPYWGSSTTGSSYRDRWTQRSITWQKASDLIGKDARTRSQEDIGEIQDLSVDPDTGRVVYGVLDHNNKFYAIPWNAIELSAGAENVVISVDKSSLDNSVAFNRDNWPDLTDRDWAVRVHSAYRVQPYWDDHGAMRDDHDDHGHTDRK